MDTNDLEYVKESLAGIRPADWGVVSDKSGVPLGTVRKIAYGEVSDPRFWTIKKLADHFRSEADEARRADAGDRRVTSDRRSATRKQ